MSDEMMLNLVVDPISSDVKQTDNKSKESNQKIYSSDHKDTSKKKVSVVNTRPPRRSEPPQKKRKLNIPRSRLPNAPLSKEFQVQEQTKDEKAEKAKEIFDSEAKGFECINQRMKDNLAQHLNITKPTKVQMKSLPIILSGKDVLMKSKTGSGKTLAYLLPCLHLLQEVRTTRTDGTYVLIIAPTRELALQITEVATVLLRQFPWIVFGSLMGGEQKKREKARIRKGLSVVVATPGRLLDHLNNTASFQVSNIKWLIMDEADRLMDLGFEKAIRSILHLLDERQAPGIKRQNLLISATLEGRIEKLASVSLNNPVFINLAGDNEVSSTNNSNRTKHITFDDDDNETSELKDYESDNNEEEEENYQVPKHLLQSYTIVETKQKLTSLISFLRLQSFSSMDTCKILVFVLTTDIVEFLYNLFDNAKFKNTDEDGETFVEEIFGVPIFKLHGNMSQGQRTTMFTKYRASKNGILFCTDVAARGLDVPNITWIVQYDAPTEIKEYVHRIGRTARFTGKGKSIIFLTPSEKEYVSQLEEHQLELREVLVEAIFNTLQIPIRCKNPSVQLQIFLEDIVTKNKKLSEFAANAFRSFTRGYSTYPRSQKHIFHVKSLHLGHVAKMFALSQPPSKIAASTLKPTKKTIPKNKHFVDIPKSEKTKKVKKMPTAAERMLSEFSA